MISDALVLPLDHAAADLATVGGKGASLARLAGAGLPVPPGFHVTTRAYRDFVAADGLHEQITVALGGLDPDDLAAVARAAAAMLMFVPPLSWSAWGKRIDIGWRWRSGC